MAVIIIVLIGGCFILGFISVLIRKCMTEENSVRSVEQSRSWNSKTRGLDKATIDALPIVHCSDLDEKDDQECPVCLTNFEPEDGLRLLPACKHIFHQDCIDMWFDSHSTCPLCRASLRNQVGTENSNNAPGASREPVGSVPEVVENGDSDIELQPISDAPQEDARREAAPGATISREEERSSARGTLSRDSQTFKQAARGVVALERAESAGVPGGIPICRRKLPLPPSSTTGIRRASSLGTDLIALRTMLMGSETPASYRLTATRSAVPKSHAPSASWFPRPRSMDLGLIRNRYAQGNPTATDIDSRKSSTGASMSKAETSTVASERSWSDRWSLSSIRSAMFPLSRTTSDVSSGVNHRLPI